MQRLPRDLVSGLGRPEAYPDDPSAAAGVETLQTHLSYLFLTRERVVKLRKAVELPFVDFSAREARVADCRHEVELNRRLAPDVYLGIAAVERDAGSFVIRERFLDEAALTRESVPECVVVMRRLEDGGDALSLLERGELEPAHLDATAARLARFHDEVGLGTPAPWEPDAWREHCYRPVASTLSSLVQSRPAEVSATALEALSQRTRARFDALADRLERRRLEGRAVDGHGDVHLQHVWFERDAPEPVLIDCVEFDPKLRRIDAASEVAFLAMDLSYRGRPDLAARFLRRYATARDDFGLFGVVDAYQGYRAAVRAKVAALAAIDPRVPADQQAAARESTLRHLELATRSVAEPGNGTLLVVCGTVGVGKSTVAEQLADRTRGVVVSSDRTRKRLAGLAPDARAAGPSDEGLYAPERKDVVYRELLERAEPVVSSGRTAILDATFGFARHREEARAWAASREVQALLVQVGCDEALAMARTRRRRHRGNDPSDAGPELVATSRARFEPPDEWPAADRYETQSDRDPEARSLDPLVARLCGQV